MSDPAVTDILRQFDPRIGLLLGWVVFVSTLLVDWIKTAASLPKWGTPAAALGANVCLVFLLAIATGIPLSGQIAAQIVLLAIVATVLAIGSKALGSRARPSTDTVTATTIVDDTASRVVNEIEERLREAQEAEKRRERIRAIETRPERSRHEQIPGG